MLFHAHPAISVGIYIVAAAKTMQSISFVLVLTAVLCSSAAADTCPNPDDSRCAGPPTNLSATANSPTQITLIWTAPQHEGDNATIAIYRVDYLTPGLFFGLGGKKNGWVHEAYVTMDDMGNLPTSYTHNHALVPGVLLRYRVSAINDFGVGAYSDGYELTVPGAADTTGNGPPDIVEIAVDGQQIVITFDENLDLNSVPSTANFFVSIPGRSRVKLESVRVTGATVGIVLTEAVGAYDTVSVSYFPPEVQIHEAVLPITTNALMDLEGNLVARFSSELATNNTSPTTSPSPTTDSLPNTHSSAGAESTQTDPSDDRAVLVAFYNATDGENWIDKTNWSSHEPLDMWYGVTANPDGRVTVLRLGSNELRGPIPDVLGRLTELAFLALDNNALSGGIPAELGGLGNLQGLYLNNNQLTGVIPLRELEALIEPTDSVFQELALWGNDQLTGMEDVSDELGKRVDRAALRMFYEGNGGPQWEENENWLHPTDPFSFSNWYGVTANSNDRVSELNLVDNGLRGETIEALDALADLETLNLSGNIGLKGTLPQNFIDLSELRTLYVEETGICASGDAVFQRWLDNIDFRGENCVMDETQEDETQEDETQEDEMQMDEITAAGNGLGCTLASDVWTVKAPERTVLDLLLIVFVLIAIEAVKVLLRRRVSFFTIR